MMKVWIIEDERALSQAFSEQLRRLRPEIEIEGISTGVKNTLAVLQGHDDFDIIFADIKIADGLSFSIFDKLETEAMVVFTTAYDEYALKAFDYNCADYLLKPISDESLEKALIRCEKHLTRMSGAQVQQMSGEIVRREVKYRKRLFLDYGHGTLICPVSKLAYVFTERGYTRVFMDDGRYGLTDKPLCDLTESLDPTHFLRVNRQSIVNIDFVDAIDHGSGRDFIAKLRAPFQKIGLEMTSEKMKQLRILLEE